MHAFQAMIASVTREDLAVATGSTLLSALSASLVQRDRRNAVTYLFRTTGQVIGVSLSGALLQSVLTAKLRERIEGPDAASVRHPARCTVYSNQIHSLLHAPVP